MSVTQTIALTVALVAMLVAIAGMVSALRSMRRAQRARSRAEEARREASAARQYAADLRAAHDRTTARQPDLTELMGNQPAEPATRPEVALVHVGEPVAAWCPRCLKTTLARSSLHALLSDGPHRIGEWAVCEDCGYSPYEETP